MSAPFVDPTQVIPFAVLGASLLGSLHCVAMCGGLVTSVAPNPKSAAFYHLGRLFGYAAIGAAAGSFGERLLGAETAWLSIVSALLIGALLIASGIRAWRGRGFHFRFPPPLARVYGRAWAKVGTPKAPAVARVGAGMLSALLPCGWLYTFALGAAATGSAVRGVAFMTFFWLGTIPALTAASAIVQRLLSPLRRRMPRLAALLLVAAGLFAIGAKVAPMTGLKDASARSSEHHSCH